MLRVMQPLEDHITIRYIEKVPFSFSFWHLMDIVLTYFVFRFSRLFQMPLSNQIRCTCIQICTQCPFAHRRYSCRWTDLNMFLSPCKDQCDLTEGGGWVGSLCRGLSAFISSIDKMLTCVNYVGTAFCMNSPWPFVHATF